MIVTILGDKYRCGSNMGITATESEGILEKLNSIIEWDLCSFPKKLKEDGDPNKSEDWVENREFLGEKPELKPGNIFVFDGQVIAVDTENRLILCVTETGFLALERFKNEVLEVEYKWKNNNRICNVSHSEVKDENDIKDYTGNFRVPYNIMRYWKQKLQNKLPEKGKALKFEFEDTDYIYPISLVIKDWDIKYNPEEVFEERINITSDNILAWCWNNLK